MWGWALVVVGLVCAVPAHAKERFVRHIGIDDKLLPENVLAIEQDATGFLWFGTGGGLVRYDGVRLEPWSPDTIRGSVARIATHDGELVAGIWSGPTYQVTAAGTSPLRGPDGAPLVGVRDLWFDRRGRLWVTTAAGVLRREHGVWSMPLANTGAAKAHRVREGFAITGRALWAIDEADRVRQVAALDDSAEYVLPMPDGSVMVSLWMGTVHRYRDGVLVERFAGRGVPRMMVHRGDVVWVIHDNAIAAIYPDGRREVLADRESIANRGTCLLVDREGSLWVGNGRGVFQFTEPDTVTWNEDDGLPTEGVRWLARTSEGLWVLQWGYAMGRIDHRRAEAVPDMALGQACVDTRGVLWGTRAQLGAPAARLVSRRDGAWIDHGELGKRASCRAGRDGVWIANAQTLWHTRGDEVREVGRHPIGEAPVIVESRTGTLYVAGDNQLCASDAATLAWTCHAIAFEPVVAMTETPSGALWLGSSRMGVARWTRAHGLEPLAQAPSRSVHVIEPARDGGLWLGGAGFLWHVTERDAGFDVVERLGPDNGVPAFNPIDLLEDEAGTVWATIGAGVLELPRSARNRPPPVLTPALIDAAFDGRAHVDALAAGDNSVKLQIASLSYRDPASIRFRVRLGDTWSAPSPQSVIQLVDLPAGDYRVEIAAAAHDAAAWVTAPTATAFTVVRAWYLRPPAWLAGGALVVLALVIARAIRARLARRLERERLGIAMDLHDDVGSSLGGIGLMAGLTADGAVDEETRREAATRIVQSARSLGDALSNIVASLRDDAGSLPVLARSLETRASMLFPDARPRLVVDYPPAWPDIRIDRRVSRNLELIVAEALHNAAKHAGAAQVTLVGRATGRELTLRVEDDGCGTGRSARKKGLGLASMRRRAARIGARFAIVSPPHAGTRVVVDVDLAKAREVSR